MSAKPITQSQIAKAAGVSQAAVSAILSGSETLNVSKETRTSVLAIAEKLGYVGRRLPAKVSGESFGKESVLMIETERSGRATGEDWSESLRESVTGRISSSAGQYLQDRGISLSKFYLSEPQKLTQWLADSDVGGVIWHADEGDSALLHWVASRFPLVLLNREWRSAMPFDSVSVDQEGNIRLAAEYLWSSGHRKIATFGHHAASSVFRRRVAAYRQFVDERNLRNYQEFQELSDALDVSSVEKVEAILQTWHALGSDAPTALITSDTFALPLVREARRRGIRIPDDLSVIGIDNHSLACALVEPALSSMAQPLEEISVIAVDLMLRRKADPSASPRSVLVAPRLVVRESVKSENQSIQ